MNLTRSSNSATYAVNHLPKPEYLVVAIISKVSLGLHIGTFSYCYFGLGSCGR